MINKAKKIIPSSCQIADTLITQISIIGNLNKNGDYVSKHVEKDDFITALLHVGDPSNGGETKYYTCLTNKSFGHLAKEISYEYGRLSVGCHDKILHCGES